MDWLKKLESSPTQARVLPFVVFLVMTTMQTMGGEAGRYWMYFFKTVVGAWFIWTIWPWVSEMRWKLSWEGIAVGILVFVMWVGLNPFYRKFGEVGTLWNPFNQFCEGSALAWFFVVVRIVGSSLVVPPLEEVFYRSFLYRYLIKIDFLKVPLGFFHVTSFIGTALVFGFAHYEWLAGILCGLAYQGLVCWKKRLGDAMTAHGVTNFLLGLWVVWKQDWIFW